MPTLIAVFCFGGLIGFVSAIALVLYYIGIIDLDQIN